MPATKNLKAFGIPTGSTVYAIIRRDVDGYLLDDGTGGFAAAPVDPYLSLSEDSVIKSRFAVAESRAVWNDGQYTVYFYLQTGGAPAPASDTTEGSAVLYIRSDVALDLGMVYDEELVLAAALATASTNISSTLTDATTLLTNLAAVAATLATVNTKITSILAAATGSVNFTLGDDVVLKKLMELQEKVRLLITAIEKQSKIKV